MLELAGRAFCVSYAEPRDVDICHEIGQSVMLDNGAFTMWTQRRPTNWPGYYRWCERWLEYRTTWAVIPDVIAGDESANEDLLAAWPFGRRGAPVWHPHETLARLARLADEWPLVCIGGSHEYPKLDSPAWRRRMAEAMNRVCDSAGRPRTCLHMLRGLQFAGGPYPLFSADSTNVARNHAGTNAGRARKSALRMAAEIDARQPPARWQRPLVQGQFLVAV